jgi:hypothetical protein
MLVVCEKTPWTAILEKIEHKRIIIEKKQIFPLILRPPKLELFLRNI